MRRIGEVEDDEEVPLAMLQVASKAGKFVRFDVDGDGYGSGKESVQVASVDED